MQHFITTIILLMVLIPAQMGEAIEKEPPEPDPVIETQELELSIKDKILLAFPDNPKMVSVAECESGLRQFNSDGTVLRGRINSLDVGIFQINEMYWLEESQRLGIDIYTVDGNIEMAQVILQQQGISAWHWSSGCHGQ